MTSFGGGFFGAARSAASNAASAAESAAESAVAASERAVVRAESFVEAAEQAGSASSKNIEIPTSLTFSMTSALAGRAAWTLLLPLCVFELFHFVHPGYSCN